MVCKVRKVVDYKVHKVVDCKVHKVVDCKVLDSRILGSLRIHEVCCVRTWDNRTWDNRNLSNHRDHIGLHDLVH